MKIRNLEIVQTPSRHSAGRRSRRRGSLLIHVLLVSMVVSVLGLSSLTVTRVYRRIRQSAADVAEARLHAQSAICLGLLRIESDPDWRYTYSNGVWEANVPIGTGTYTIEGIDPTDDTLGDAQDEPLILIGTGRKGEATHRLQITVSPTRRGFTALQSALHAGNNVECVGATLNCDQVASANQNVTAASSAVNCAVQAVNAVSGATFNGTTQEGITARTMPNTNTVFQYYLEHGTWIDRDSLPRGYPNILKNPGFEAGPTDWTAAACTISQSTAQAHTGSASLLVRNRSANTSGPEQNITSVIQKGVTHDVSCWVRVSSATDVAMRVGIQVTTASGTTWFWSSSTNVKSADGWRSISRQLTPTWSGSLISATLRVASDTGAVSDFYVDDLILKETGNDPTIFRTVLSPNSNPFGPTTNAEGIYIIDLSDNRLFIKNSRIVGTLVLITPNTASQIGGGTPLNWEPAVPGYPALLVNNRNVTINPSNFGLNESVNQTNFNPAGTPYEDAADSDQGDVYPSEINGLIYGTRKILFYNQPVLRGVVIAHEDIEVYGLVTVTHNSSYLLNPPPGFSAAEKIRTVLGSAMKPLD